MFSSLRTVASIGFRQFPGAVAANQDFCQVKPGDLVQAAVAFGKFKQALAAALNGIDAEFQVFQLPAKVGICGLQAF